MYSVQYHIFDKYVEYNTADFAMAKDRAYDLIKAGGIYEVEIWMGKLFVGRLKKEGHI
jgi:hypothetical protein